MKGTLMEKIKIVVDTPCDIPDKFLARYGIEMVGVPIVVDGREYVERKSFSIQEFYPILEGANELPVTSRVPIGEFVEAYTRAWNEGCTDVIVVTMNSNGSGTYESAHIAMDLFFTEVPEAGGFFSIHLIDSMTYSLAYGYPVVRAASMAQLGKSVKEILVYLYDFFSRVEIYIVCYSLEYAKKSGRISAAAAFVGEMLGMRPIIAMVDGATKIVEKVRGDRNATRKLAEVYHQRRVSAEDIVITASAAVDEYGRELKALVERDLGRSVLHCKLGAAVTINTGPRAAALCLLGKKRERDGHGSGMQLSVLEGRRSI